MGGHYEKGLYDQLMDVMAKLDILEAEQKNDRKEIKTLTAEVTSLRKENGSLRDKVSRLQEENAALSEKCGHLEKECALLLDDNERMKSILNNDSSNTSNPPSTDRKRGRPANAYNGREKSGRKQGGQKGHKGSTLTRENVEEKIRSGKCIHRIKNVGDTSAGKYTTRYVVDLEVTPIVTEIRIYANADGKFSIPEEYRSSVTYGPCVKSLAVMLYSEGVMANDRIADFLNAAAGESLGLSDGSIYHFCSEFGRRAEESIRHLEEEQLSAPIVATDATLVTVNGEPRYIRNFSTGRTVLYAAMKDKTLKAMKEVPFLRKYTGALIHDHETALYHFGIRHGECNVHLLRYLRKNTEETGNSWSGQMSGMLSEINRERKRMSASGGSSFPDDTISAYERKYDDIVAQGYKENKGTRYKYAQTDEKRLLNRLVKYKTNHLLFLHDFEIPFDDNMSERDLRKAKNRQKMSGGFRKSSGHEMYCNILTIIETIKRRKLSMINNIKELYLGRPAIF